MRELTFILAFCVIAMTGFCQKAEPCRYEAERWSKEQKCHFVSLQEQGVLLAMETQHVDDSGNVIWDFVRLDTLLNEKRNDHFPLPKSMSFIDANRDAQHAAFIFSDEKARKTDSVALNMVVFDRNTFTFKCISDMLPVQSTPLSVSVLDGNAMVAVNNKAGNGELVFYDLTTGHKSVTKPAADKSYVIFQSVAIPNEHVFVVAVKEFEDKRFVSTSFLQYSASGALMRSCRYDNGENAVLGRMCFDFDKSHNLVVYATLERVGTKKVSLKGVTDNFDNISVGVIWIGFHGTQPQTKAYLFKNMPNIEKALTPSDRVSVRAERIKLNKKKSEKKSEIAFQFLTPHLLKYDGLSVFSAEAFVPQYHTETRMDYGFYGMYPYSYTIFDGYDFISDILLAFDDEGNLKWQTSSNFDNDLTFNLMEHASESVCFDELVVSSPRQNVVRYEIFNANGQMILDQQQERLDFLYGADFLDDEDYSAITTWYGNRFLVYGSQNLQNSVQPKPRRDVYFFQKVQMN